MTETEFVEQVKQLGINSTEEQLSKLEKLYEIMIEENKVMNLTRIISKADVYLKHFYDRLTITKVCDLTGNLTLCDVGTGAGFPGIPLKIYNDTLKVTLLDSLNKRINFLNEVIKSLDLKDIKTIHSRAEDAAHMKEYREKYDVSISRAVAQLNVLVEYLLPFVKVGGRCICMKGSNAEEEIKNVKNAIKELGG